MDDLKALIEKLASAYEKFIKGEPLSEEEREYVASLIYATLKQLSKLRETEKRVEELEKELQKTLDENKRIREELDRLQKRVEELDNLVKVAQKSLYLLPMN